MMACRKLFKIRNQLISKVETRSGWLTFRNSFIFPVRSLKWGKHKCAKWQNLTTPKLAVDVYFILFLGGWEGWETKNRSIVRFQFIKKKKSFFWFFSFFFRMWLVWNNKSLENHSLSHIFFFTFNFFLIFFIKIATDLVVLFITQHVIKIPKTSKRIK